jgi:hypothetical protein
MSNFYVFIAADADTAAWRKLPATEVAMSRLRNSMWPLYVRTRNRAVLQKGDHCLFYAAGRAKFAQHFLATAEINSISPRTRAAIQIDPPEAYTDTADKIIHLSNVKIFETPIGLRPLLDELSFIPENRLKWGSILQGGCLRLSRDDYARILAQQSPKKKYA